MCTGDQNNRSFRVQIPSRDIVYSSKSGSQFVIMSVLFDPPESPDDPESMLDFMMQRLACASWTRISTDVKIRIWMDTAEGCRRASVYPEFLSAKCSSIPNRSLDNGKPYLDSFWLAARAEYPEHVLIWLNSDIIVTPESFIRIDAAISTFPEATVISRRTDFNISRSFTVNDVFRDLNRVIDDATMNGALHDETGIDMFAFRAESPVIDNIPPFVIGAYRWDNWLVFWSLREKLTVVDISKYGIMLHAVKPSNVRHHSSRRGAEYNDILCKSVVGELYKMGTVLNADHLLTAEGATLQMVPNRHQSIAVYLARRAGPSRWIAVVTVSEAYLEFAYQWLCNIKRIGVSHYVFLAQDAESKRRLSEANEAVVEASDFDLSSDLRRWNLTASSSAEAEYGSVEFQMTMTLRTLVLKKILSFGFNVITADLDSIWLQDPLPIFDKYAIVQGQEHKKTKVSGGFVAIRSGAVGRDYWQKVCDCQVANMQFLATARPGTYLPSQYTEQECVNDEAMKMVKRNASGFAVHILPATYFPDGLSYFTKFESARQGVLPYVVHNNWVVGMKAKLDRLRRSGLFFNGSDFRTCPPHPLRPGYGLTMVTRSEQQVALKWADKAIAAKPYRYRIHVLTMDRPESLKRLLASMQAANYGQHAVAVVFLVDRPKPDAGEETHRRWSETLSIARSFRLGPDVMHEVVEHERNQGLISQWIDPWPATDSDEVMIILEDDIQVSPVWFNYVTKITERYYRKGAESGGDPSLAGFSLQCQHTILGERPDLRYGQATPASLLTDREPLYRYQLPSTWGSVWFPHAWSAFLGWVQNLQLNRRRGTSRAATPCVPTLISNSWWKQKPGSIWSVWIVRFAFEHGYYFLYTNLPDNSALVINHREAGIHFGGNKGPDSRLVRGTETDLIGKVNLNSLPDLASIPLFDLHFRRVSDGESLRWNSFVLSPHGLERCSPFNRSLSLRPQPVFGFVLSAPVKKKI